MYKRGLLRFIHIKTLLNITKFTFLHKEVDEAKASSPSSLPLGARYMKKILPIRLHHIKIPKSQKYLTVKETANLLSVTPLTLRNWDKLGKLKALRNPINNYRLYKPRDIELFLRKIESKGKINLG